MNASFTIELKRAVYTLNQVLGVGGRSHITLIRVVGSQPVKREACSYHATSSCTNLELLGINGNNNG